MRDILVSQVKRHPFVGGTDAKLVEGLAIGSPLIRICKRKRKVEFVNAHIYISTQHISKWIPALGDTGSVVKYKPAGYTSGNGEGFCFPNVFQVLGSCLDATKKYHQDRNISGGVWHRSANLPEI